MEKLHLGVAREVITPKVGARLQRYKVNYFFCRNVQSFTPDADYHVIKATVNNINNL